MQLRTLLSQRPIETRSFIQKSEVTLHEYGLLRNKLFFMGVALYRKCAQVEHRDQTTRGEK